MTLLHRNTFIIIIESDVPYIAESIHYDVQSVNICLDAFQLLYESCKYFTWT